MAEPGSLAPSASVSLSRRTRSRTNRNKPPTPGGELTRGQPESD
jgi:hypothetical protein